MITGDRLVAVVVVVVDVELDSAAVGELATPVTPSVVADGRPAPTPPTPPSLPG